MKDHRVLATYELPLGSNGVTSHQIIFACFRASVPAPFVVTVQEIDVNGEPFKTMWNTGSYYRDRATALESFLQRIRFEENCNGIRELGDFARALEAESLLRDAARKGGAE